MAPTSCFFAPIICSLLFLSALSPSIEASNGGFSVELIHIDSPKSPFYNPRETPYQRTIKALRRSRNPIPGFQTTSSNSSQGPISEVWRNKGSYLMNISIGTPPFEIIAIADTGSDLIWTQCQPCYNCFFQDQPLFDPKSSKTYKDLSCTTRSCESLSRSSCDGRSGSGEDGSCFYQYSYGDQSYTTGNLATETIALSSTSGRPVSFPTTVFGCGHDNGGTFNEKGSGIVGLGGGPLSLVSQMGKSIDGKFSYCLVPFFSRAGNSSTLYFGSKSVPKGPGVQSTPLLSNDTDTFYYLALESFSVGDTTINFGASSADGSRGNIIIDSGTTLTFLPSDVYRNLSGAVDKAIGATHADDPHGTFDLCYTSDSFKGAPDVIAHFRGGADVKLVSNSTFIAISDTVVCFAFRGVGATSIPIFGNLAQMNHLVAYDIKGKTVSFKQTDCTKV